MIEIEKQDVYKNVNAAISKYYNSKDNIEEAYEFFCKRVDAYYKFKIDKKLITPQKATKFNLQLKYDVYSYKNDNIEPTRSYLYYL